MKELTKLISISRCAYWAAFLWLMTSLLHRISNNRSAVVVGIIQKNEYTLRSILMGRVMNGKAKNVPALLILVIACAAVISGCGGLKEIPQKDSELIGVTLSASERIFYMEDCNMSGSCGETKTVREVDRALVCRRLNTTVTHIYNNNYEINKSTAFDIVKVFDVECYGLRCAFSSGYPLVVLEDSQGVFSTYPRFFIDFEERDVCGFSF